MMKVLDYLTRQPRRSIWLHGALGIVVVGTVDYFTGPELAFSIFYLVPIALVAWRIGRAAGLVVALVSAVIWLQAELLWSVQYSHPLVPFWNGLVRAGLFVVSAALISEIAQRKRVEAALRGQTSILESILNSMGDGVIVADHEGKILLHNPAAERLLKQSVDGGGSSDWFTTQKLFLPDRLTPLGAEANPLLKAIRGESTNDVEIFLRGTDGSELWISATGRPLIENRKAKGGVVVLSDVSARKLLEKQVAEASDREQLRIGQDLHDGVCQKLVSAAFASSVLQQKLAQQKLPEAAGAAEHIVDMINDVISDARGLARGLYPVKLELDGLQSALESLVDNVGTYASIKCRFECHGPVLIHDPIASTNLYRIAQEALNNAVKHSQARNVVVELEAVEDEITLSVQDDGVGFPVAGQRREGMGLHIMNYRARLIGASLDVRRRAQGGTIVICSFLNCSQVNKTNEPDNAINGKEKNLPRG